MCQYRPSSFQGDFPHAAGFNARRSMALHFTWFKDVRGLLFSRRIHVGRNSQISVVPTKAVPSTTNRRRGRVVLYEVANHVKQLPFRPLLLLLLPEYMLLHDRHSPFVPRDHAASICDLLITSNHIIVTHNL